MSRSRPSTHPPLASGLILFFMCMASLCGLGAAADDFRQRNIFPLPELGPGDTEGGIGFDWTPLANQGIKTLNELAGCFNSSFSTRKKPTRVQRRVLQHVAECYRDAFHEFDPKDSQGALSNLCSSSKTYDSGRGDVQPYVKENISWPQVSNRPVPLGECLPDADREWLGAWRQHMLQPDDVCKSQRVDVVPYIDPILKHNPQAYNDFLKELVSRNMIDFKIDDGSAASLGVFFVKKKSGQLRLIFDTRKLNQEFVPPPSTDLPSADAFTRTEFVESSPFYVGSGDLANAFYTLAVPRDLAEKFTLPAIEAWRVGVAQIDGIPILPGAKVTPFITVLPMGWSWALHLCQSVLLHAISVSGFKSKQIIGDKRESVTLKEFDDLAVAAYVDNFGVFGSSSKAVDAGLDKIIQTLRAWGLQVHEIEPASLKADFVGLSFDGQRGTVSIKSSRINKIKFAIDELLERQFCSGRVMQLLVGHITWALLCRRSGLSLLNACYAFIGDASTKHKRLWKSVRQELHWISSLLPLLRFKVNSSWGHDVTSSDSSPWGLGVCYRQLDVETVQTIGRSSERWRYIFPDATNARAHALDDSNHCMTSSIDNQVSMQGCNEDDDHSNLIRDGHFEEVPPSILESNDWKVAWSRPWKFEANILNTEARALVWSAELLLRCSRSFGKRLLCLTDNLPLALGVCKGRAKSQHLKSSLRKICALSLATQSKIHVRWVPSERNVADKPSRATDRWIAQGHDHWWVGKSPFDGEVHHEQKAAKADWAICNKASGPERQNSKIRISATRNDLPGISECEGTNTVGLHSTDGRVQPLVGPACDSNQSARGGRQYPCRVPPGLVRLRCKTGCGNSDSCSHQVSTSIIGKDLNWKPPQVYQSPQGVEECRPSLTKDAFASGGLRCHSRIFPCHEQDSDGGSFVPPMDDLHAAGGSKWANRSTASGSNQKPSRSTQLLCSASSPVRDGRAGKNRPLRSRDFSRQRSLDQLPPITVDSSKTAHRSTLDSQSQRVAGSLSNGCQPSSPQRSRCLIVLFKAWRSVIRRYQPKEGPSRSQTKRTVECRLFPSQVCQSGKTSERDAQDSSQRCGVRTVHHGQPSADAWWSDPHPPATTWNEAVTKRMISKAQKNHVGPKGLSPPDLLRFLFKKVCKANRCRRVYLDIFSGDQGISREIQKRGEQVISIDTCDDSRLDITDPSVVGVVLGWINSGCIKGIWLATPCTSWSRARHGPVGSSWGPLRTNQFLFGIPGLDINDRTKIRLGNSTMNSTVRIIRAAVRCQIPVFLENPATSMLWKVPKIERLCALTCCRFFLTDFCQHGARWRKRTRVAAWHGQPCPQLSLLCSGRGGICSRNHKHHIVLKGQDPKTRQLWTHLAQPYPKQFASVGGLALIHAVDCLDNYKLFFAVW